MSQHRQPLGEPGAPYLKADQLRVERRGWPRMVTEEAVTAVFSGGDRMGVARIEIVDKSLTGIGARCRNELTPGMRVRLGQPGMGGPVRSGTVVRCDAEGDHYCVGIRLDKALMAA